MTTLTYNLSRQQAANKLGVSTRTIDRYVKGGKLSYKKVANKVILATEEVDELHEDFNLLHEQTAQAEVTKERRIPIEKVRAGSSSTKLSTQQAVGLDGVVEFANILTKKDQTIEEKNQLIFALQHRLGELETKMSQMVALPDYTQQKQTLETTITSLQQEVKKEKLRNAVYIGLVLMAAVMILFFTFMS